MDEIAESVPVPSIKYDMIVDLLLVFGIALNVYLIMDWASGGTLTRNTVSHVKQARHDVGIWWGVQRDRLTVIEHATEALYDDPEDNT